MLTLLIYSMATWRIASMFVAEAGPGDFFLKVRESAGIVHDESKRPAMVPDGLFPSLLSCIWCCSFFVGAFWMIFDVFSPWLALRLAAAFAFSTGAILIQCVIDARKS